MISWQCRPWAWNQEAKIHMSFPVLLDKTTLMCTVGCQQENHLKRINSLSTNNLQGLLVHHQTLALLILSLVVRLRDHWAQRSVAGGTEAEQNKTCPCSQRGPVCKLEIPEYPGKTIINNNVTSGPQIIISIIIPDQMISGREKSSSFVGGGRE